MRKKVDNPRRDHKDKIIYPYKPAPGGRIEVRFKDKDDRITTRINMEMIREKTGMSFDKIITQAIEELNKKYDNKGNLV